ncbi:tenascin-like isoform X5 [Nelusetta ayraudi]|uniref:tenascin-like isoform X5 n=1 Tax=Nelusetta ayraudi TaxID=303726 RepID=UPI003F711C18
MDPRCLLTCLLLAALMGLSNPGLVKKILRHRRQTLSSAKENNVSLPDAGHPVVFNHVYSINVPASSLCSVNLDSPDSIQVQPQDASGHLSTDHTVDGENQIVFTHRINIPRQACGCADETSMLKDLMSRLEVLEGEVSVLRDQCSVDRACCSAQVTGEVGTKPYCSGHGNYSVETCSCVCESGWRGANCSESNCPGNCMSRGRCIGGKCECFQGFKGEDCALEVCLVHCGAQGQCVRGVCVCSDGFFGENCSETKCPNDCQDRGRCEDGTCACQEPWTGLDCSQLSCPKNCFERGRCVNGTCDCDEGFLGKDCGERACPNKCHGNGFCVDGSCVCIAGFSGTDCSQLTCLNDCNGRGACFNGLCICHAGYQGEDCSQIACPNNCNSRGQCINGQCACDVGFHGDDCAELSCPNDCLQRGRCVNGQCVCEEGYAGEDCRILTCPSNCYGRGTCIEGVCSCHAGFAGEDCSKLSCPNDCANRGRCVDGQCVCDEGFAREDCSQKACPNDCLARGQCLDGKCVCQEGYAGEDCSVLSCPANCNNRGRCVGGKCACESGYEGESCGELSCLNNCQDKGRCENGQCLCDEGYIGEDCSEVSPAKDLTVGEVTSETVDVSWQNEMLVTDYLVTYVPTGPGGLLQEFMVSGDNTAATVKGLEPGIEYLISVYAVLNNKRSVPISARVATELPQPKTLIFKSVRETSVEVMWDHLDVSFDGWEIYFRNTKEENGKVLSTLPSSQNKFVQSGLGPGQEYEVSINVVKNNTRGPQTSRRVTTRIDGPQQVEVKDVTDTSALVSWSQPVAPADRVTMVYGLSSDPSGGTSVDVFPPDKQSSIDGLRPDTEYKVSLISRRGEQESSEPVAATFTTALDAPMNLQAVSQTDSSITLQWTNSRATVGSYRVKYSPFSGASHGEELFPQGLEGTTKATLTGLKPGTEYGIGVTAVKNERESLPATTNAETDIDPPRDLVAVESTETTVSLRWQKPLAKVGAYRLVYVSSDGQVSEDEIPPTQTSYVMTNLTPGMSYRVTLAAERGLKKSPPAAVSASTASFTFYLAGSDDRDLTTPASPSDSAVSFAYSDPSESQFSGMEPEDEPGTLTVSGVTADGFDLSWKLSGPGVYDSLAVECRDAQQLWDVRELRLPGDVTGSRIQGLKPLTAYQIKLYGITTSQKSALLEAVAITAPKSTSADLLSVSVEDASTTPQSHPEEDLLRPPSTDAPDAAVTSSGSGSESPELKLSNLTFSVSSASIRLAWSAPQGAFDDFWVQVTAPGVATPVFTAALPGHVRDAEIEGLSPSSQYDITLHGQVDGKRSLPLNVLATTAEELRPTVADLAISDITWDGFTASWSPAGGDFDSFVIEVTNMENEAESQNLTLSGGALSLGISGLNPNTSYLVGLYGIHGDSVLEPLYIEATTEAEPEVEHLFVSDTAANSFRLSWTSDEDMFDRFVIKIRDSKRVGHPREYNVGGAERTKVIAGLMSGTEYEIELYGVTLDERSQPITGVAQTALSTPKGLRFSEVSDSSAVVHWSSPRAPVDSYRVAYMPFEGGSPMMVTVDGGVFEALLSNMVPGKMYQVTVSSVKGLEESDPSTDTVTTALDRPQGLTAVNVTDTSALLLWQPSYATVDGYLVTYSADTAASKVEHVSGNLVEFEMGSLAPGTRYTVEVQAVKDSQKSDSAVTEFTTNVDPPRDLTAVNVQTDSATLTWRPPQAAVTGYTLTFSSTDGTIREVVLSPTASSYSMAQLAGSTEYNVRLQAIAGAQRSRHISTAFTTIGQLYRRPKDCAQVLLNGETASGLYTVYIGGEESQPVQVYCDMTTDGGGWMVFLRRQSGKLDFYRNWKNYTAGFGNMNDEFWLGLTNLYRITNSGHYELRVDLRDDGELAYAQYDKFTIAEPRTRYKIYIGAYSGTAGDSMTYHQGRPFSTYDNDNDIAVTNCALSYKGAFWYKNCHRVNLMGKYGEKSHSKGINWFHWKGHEHSIEFAEMKLRPANFKNFESRKKRS